MTKERTAPDRPVRRAPPDAPGDSDPPPAAPPTAGDGAAETPRRGRSGAARAFFAALPFLGTAAILTLLLRRVRVDELLEAFAEADLPLFLAALLPVSVLYVAFDAGLLRAVLGWFHPPRLTLREALSVRAVDYLVSLWNGRASQAALLGLLGRRFTVAGDRRDSGYLECAGTILFLDLSHRLHLLLWAGAGAIVVGSAAPEQLPAVAAVGIGGLSLLAVFLRGRLRVGGAGVGPPRWRILRSFERAGLRRYLGVLAWKAPPLLAAAVGHHFALRAFRVEIPIAALLTTLPIIFVAAALPITVGRIGTSQAAWLYLHAGTAAASPGGEPGLLAYSLAAHLTFLVANAALAAPFLPAAWRSLRLGANAPAASNPNA